MKQLVRTTLTLSLLTAAATAQDVALPDYGQEYIGHTTPSASEPMFQYDDLEVWKHGWIQINPYEHGYHSYRPYNYKQVFAQSAQSAQWGMPSTMPYSQSYYLQHGPLTGINGEPLPNANGIVPTPNYNAPGFGNPAFGAPDYRNPGYTNPADGAPGYPAPGYGMPTSMIQELPFHPNAGPQQFNNIPGLTQLPGHQFPPQPQQQYPGYPQQPQSISPAGFQQMHLPAAAGPELERKQLQRNHMLQLLEQDQPQGPSFR